MVNLKPIIASRKGEIGLVTLLLVVAILIASDTRPLSGISGALSSQLAAVTGMNAGVEPNPDNILAQELKQREETLTLREQALRDREAALETTLRNEIRGERWKLLTVLAVAIVLLSGLIGLNFYLDRKRRPNERGSLAYTTKLT